MLKETSTCTWVALSDWILYSTNSSKEKKNARLFLFSKKLAIPHCWEVTKIELLLKFSYIHYNPSEDKHVSWVGKIDQENAYMFGTFLGE